MGTRTYDIQSSVHVVPISLYWDRLLVRRWSFFTKPRQPIRGKMLSPFSLLYFLWISQTSNLAEAQDWTGFWIGPRISEVHPFCKGLHTKEMKLEWLIPSFTIYRFIQHCYLSGCEDRISLLFYRWILFSSIENPITLTRWLDTLYPLRFLYNIIYYKID